MNPLLSIAIQAAGAAGKEIMDIYNDPKADFGIELKADNSPLTIADKKAHQVIARMLAATHIPILSEEGAHLDYDVRKAWRCLWMVDPLDGTKEFIKRNGEFTVNIALIELGAPILGVVYVPATATLYFGDTSEGAWRITLSPSTQMLPPTDELLRRATKLPQKREDEDFVIVASRSHMNAETEAYIRRTTNENASVRIISCGSSIKLCRVAEGNADAYPRFAPTMEWDTAAGHAIVQAAGHQVLMTNEQTPLHYNKKDLHNPPFIAK